MKSYKITGKLILGFIFNNDQHDIVIDSGTLESDGHTVWFIELTGKRYESTTTANVIEDALERGRIEPIS